MNNAFEGEKYTASKPTFGGAQYLGRRDMEHFGNSGVAAISMAQFFGGEKAVLLGYDCHKRNGSHWHGDHPRGLGNAGSIARWPILFQHLTRILHMQVINASPGTNLRCFPTRPLEPALDWLSQ